MAKFFIDRPIFAIVIAILVMLAGGLSILSMPIEQYPTIAPPSIQITATYPGASAETVENTVVQVIEQQMSGLDHLLYISSNSDDSGTATTTLTWKTFLITFQSLDFGLGSAYAYTVSFITFALAIVYFRALYRRGEFES